MSEMIKATRQEAETRCFRPKVVAWAVCRDSDGRKSICPLGWHMMTSSDPPMVAISVAPKRFTHELISRAGEFVLAFPGEDQAAVTLDVGIRSARSYDKFAAHNLTVLESECCQTPIIEECVANLECRVVGRLETGDHTIFAGQVLQYWQSSDDQRPLLLVDDLGGYEQLLKGGRYQFGAVKH